VYNDHIVKNKSIKFVYSYCLIILYNNLIYYCFGKNLKLNDLTNSKLPISIRI